MSIKKYITRIALASSLVLPGVLNAAIVTLPALDIADMGTDIGATVTADTFSINATAFTIITDTGPIEIADEMFTLNSLGSYDSTAHGGLGYGSFEGTFSVGSLLSGTFSNLEVFGYGNGTTFDIEANLDFLSGSLKGSFNEGVLVGVKDGDFLTAKLGTVSPVPVPAAVWLFGTGLLGLVGIARRKSIVAS